MTIYVHCGLHKTATTALQIALSNHTEQLRAAGFLYPFTGRVGDVGGQHNLAWQIARDRRFDKRYGDINALGAEISDFSGDVILSSEDFESSLHRPAAFAPLLEYVRQTGKDLVLVIYLRNQIAYLESLYQEMLKHGFGEEYEVYANEVIAHGNIRMHEWVFHFDYSRIAEAFSTTSHVKLIFRNFHSAADNSLILDFASVVGIDKSILADATDIRSNERDSYARSLFLFYQNRIGRPLDKSETDAVESLCSHAIGKLGTTGPIRNAIVHGFQETNARMCQRHHIPTIGLNFDDDTNAPSSTITTSMQKFFSFETHNTLKELASFYAQPSPLDDANIVAKAAAERLGGVWFDSLRTVWIDDAVTAQNTNATAEDTAA